MADDKPKDFDLLKEIRDRFHEAYDAVQQSYSDIIDDLEFLEGDQWPQNLEKDRLADGRPCLVINKLPTFADQVSGDIRMNSPSIKVKPVDSEADPETAEVFTGLIRNIEVQSEADIAYDTAGECAVNGGLGAFRIATKYATGDTFDQDICFLRIKNPLTIYWDPASQDWNKTDAQWCFITEKMSRDEFTRKYPNAAIMSAEGGKDRDSQWGDDKSIRVAEYFRKIPETKTLRLVRDYETFEERVVNDETWRDMDKEAFEVLKTREIDAHRIEWYKTNGREILEGPNRWPGKYIPIVMVYGKELNIEGRTVYRGVVRHAKDSQRLYNYSRSHGAEVTSLAPKSPYIVSAKMIGNYQKIWDNAHKKNYPYLAVDADPNFPGMLPQRQPPISVNTGIRDEIMISDQEMHDTTGLQQASLGKKSNEKSGKAILARQREGDVANYAYYDNLVRAIRHAGRILVDLIPKIYDTARIVRLLNEEGQDEFVPVNQPLIGQNGQPAVPPGPVMQKAISKNGRNQIFDLTVGKYDVVASVGPSYTTQREEAAESMMMFLQAVPDAGPLIADLVAKNMDWPGAQEFEKRLKALLPPQLAQGGEQGVPPPAPQPPPPNPIEMKKLEKTHADIEFILKKSRHEDLKMEETLARIENLNRQTDTMGQERGSQTS